MPPPHEDLRERLHQYLLLEFQPETQLELTLAKAFERHPIDNSRGGVYAFSSKSRSGAPEPYYAVASLRGVANFYPQWGFSPDDIWAVHVGTDITRRAARWQRPRASLQPEPPAPAARQRMVQAAVALAKKELGSAPSTEPAVEAVYELRMPRTFLKWLIRSEHIAAGTLQHASGVKRFVVGDRLTPALFDSTAPAHALWRLQLGRTILGEPEPKGSPPFT